MANAPPLLAAGTQLGNYEVVRVLGYGGFGAVYEARHKLLKRRVAIKCLHPHIAANKELAGRFYTEMIASTRLEHPNVVQVLEVGKHDDGSPFMVMEYLEGQTLSQRIKSQGRLGKNGLYILWQIAVVLAEAHRKGITHRDLKPANLMLVPDATAQGGEKVKLLDFGIAKLSPEAVEDYASGLVEVKTKTGTHLGTPVFMAPEQWDTYAARDNKIDVYAFGILAYLVLGGRLPFASADDFVLKTMHMLVDPEPLQSLNADLPPGVLSLVHRSLGKLADERPSMDVVRDELAALLDLHVTPAQMRMRGTSEIAALIPKTGGKSGHSLGTLSPTPDGLTGDAPTVSASVDQAGQSSLASGPTQPRSAVGPAPQIAGLTAESVSRASGQQVAEVIAKPGKRVRWIAAVGVVAALVLLGVVTTQFSGAHIAAEPPPAARSGMSPSAVVVSPMDMAGTAFDAALTPTTDLPDRASHHIKKPKKRYVPPTVP